MDKKKNQGRRARRRVYRKKRRRTGLLVFLGLVVLTLGALLLFGTDQTSQTVDQTIGRVSNPAVDGAPEIAGESATKEDSATDKGTATEEESTDDLASTEEDEDKPVAIPPDDSTMSLSIPKLGISGAVVGEGEGALEPGVEHLPGTGFPWQPNSNTYIAGHRVGFPGTGSDHIFYSLPSLSEGDEVILSDSLGQEYTYRVSDV
ncbi:MAG: sortase, partial [Actinobacteria bacterium]|nr:sortase [Actinomycetota bacterium]